MYAIARIAGKQFRIEPDTNVKVPRLPVEEGAKYEIADIIMTSDGQKVQLGQPTLSGIKVVAKVISHGRDPKVIVFRKKRRKGFKVTKGHRQGFTLLHIEKIQGLEAKVAKPKAAAKPKADEKPKAAPKPKAEVKPKAAPKPKAEAKPKPEAKPKAAPKKKAPAKPKAEAKPKTPAKPKAEAKPKPAAKPKAPAKAKTAAKPKAPAKKKTTKSEKSKGE